MLGVCQRPRQDLRKVKLHALVYDIHPPRKKVPESDARSVAKGLSATTVEAA